MINLVLPMPLKNPRRTLGPIELEDVAGRPGGGIMFATAPCTDTRLLHLRAPLRSFGTSGLISAVRSPTSSINGCGSGTSTASRSDARPIPATPLKSDRSARGPMEELDRIGPPFERRRSRQLLGAGAQVVTSEHARGEVEDLDHPEGATAQLVDGQHAHAIDRFQAAFDVTAELVVVEDRTTTEAR